jgi:uncharacterized protein (DUF697 family)
MKLEDITDGITGFSKWKHTDKIKFFAWYLHSKRSRFRFMPTDIKACYVELGMEQPSSINPFLTAMVNRKPKEMLHDKQGYALEKSIRDKLETKYGQRVATVQADKLLSELSGKISSAAERGFLDEAITCFRCKAFRASIVMCWNLAYDHLCDYILNKHLATFNARMPIRYQNMAKKTGITAITARDDFAELKESEVIEICRSANIITNDVYKILNDKLGKRNTAAHPSTVTVLPHSADEFIIDLVTNVVLKLV